jgi:N-acetyl-gamma-glutamyl-phosphate reductase
MKFHKLPITEKNMLNVGIVGATGYAGEELIAILLRHPGVLITSLSAQIDKPRKISEIFSQFKNKLNLICALPDKSEIILKCDLVFLALPHTVSMEIAPKLLGAGKKVIDLSADYRLKDTKVYERFYKTRHKDKAHLREAVYGLPELYRVKIKKARLIANPGCYPTGAILGIVPLLVANIIDVDSIFIDAKSGFSGAGREAVARQEKEILNNLWAYKVNIHQHMPEIDQELSKFADGKVSVTFVPHILPLKRGILETIYLKIQNPKSKIQNLIDLYRKFYKKEPFVRILDEGSFPQLKNVVGTNFCEIGIHADAKKGVIIVIAALDNLLKGASGEAVQNLNIMYGFPEYTALV